MTQTRTMTNHEIVIGDHIVTISSLAKPEDVATELGKVPGIEATYNSWAGLRVVCTTQDRIDDMPHIKRQINAMKLDAGKGVLMEVHVMPAGSMRCAVCGWSVTREAMELHMASPECSAAKNITDLHNEGFVEVTGSATKAIAQSTVEARWLLAGMSLGVGENGRPQKDGSLAYTRLVPSWSVDLANVTIVPLHVRVAVIDHCQQHLAARDALIAALKLGPGRTKARAPKAKGTLTEEQKTQNRNEKQRMTDLFMQALRTVG